MKGLGQSQPVSGKSAKQQAAVETVEEMDLDVDSGPASSHAGDTKQNWAQCTVIINNLAVLLLQFGLRDQPDILRTIVDAVVELTRQYVTGVVLWGSNDYAVFRLYEAKTVFELPVCT